MADFLRVRPVLVQLCVVLQSILFRCVVLAAAGAVVVRVAMNLDETLMNFVNVLGISIFVTITLFHFVQAAAKKD
jgi:hypothetical protein